MKETKLNYKTMDKIADANGEAPVEITFGTENGETASVTVKRYISPEGRVAFINTVRAIVFCEDADTNETDYRSCFEEPAISFAICKYLTNLKMDDFIRTCNIYSNSAVMNKIREASERLYDELYRAAKDEIEYRKHELLSANKRETEKLILECREQNRQFAVLLEEMKDFDFGEAINILGKMSGISEKERVNAVLEFQRKEEAAEK